MNRDRPEPAQGYQRICHPVTGRFMFSIDPQRGIALLTDKGMEAFVDLTQYGWQRREPIRADSVDVAQKTW